MQTLGLLFYRYQDLWIVTGQGLTPSGLTIAIEPVVKIRADDAVLLAEAISEQLGKRISVPEPDSSDPATSRTLMAVALNLKNFKAFYEHARAFYVQQSPNELSVQEWKKGRGATFTTPALWKRVFSPGDFSTLAWFLAKHEDVAFPVDPQQQKRGPA